MSNIQPVDWEHVRSLIYSKIDTPTVWLDTVGVFSKKKNIKSPFREDKSPSFTFFRDKDNSSIWYGYDFSKSTRYDIFQAISIKENISYGQAIYNLAQRYLEEDQLKESGLIPYNKKSSLRRQINDLYTQFRIDAANRLLGSKPDVTQVSLLEKEGHSYSFDWGDNTLSRAFISKRIKPSLVHYCPLSLMEADVIYYTNEEGEKKKRWLNTESNPCFVWVEHKEDGEIIERQIYRPFADKVSKFRNLDKEPYYFKGFNRKFNKLAILTKGYKDAYMLNSSGFNVFGKCGEGKSFEESFLLSLKGKGIETIFIFFDNDEAGKRASEKLLDQLESIGLFKVVIVKSHYEMETKDYDEMILKYGFKNAKKMLQHWIKKIA